jgi:hypothetical protein
VIEVQEEEHVQIHIRRKILSAAAALVVAVPVGIVASLYGPTMFASAAGIQDPVMCNVTGTASFNPVLTHTGTNTGKGSVETVTLSGFSMSHCLSSSASGAPSSATFSTTSVNIEATKVGAGKTAQYLTGYCPGFASTNSLKALKNLSLTTNWSGGEGGTTTIETKTPTVAGNSGGEAGFAIVAKYETGSYASKQVQAIIYLTSAETANLGGGCASGSVSSITFDGATSTVLQ